MLKIFLASHGHLASGMKSSLEILLGNADHITIYDAYVDATSMQDALDAFYLTVKEEDQVLLLSDLYGGSVNQVMYTYLQKPNTNLIAGVNLACVLELSIKESITEEDVLSVIEQSRQMLTLVKLDVTQDVQDDFF